jgi:hypothetical protein
LIWPSQAVGHRSGRYLIINLAWPVAAAWVDLDLTYLCGMVETQGLLNGLISREAFCVG